MIIFFITLLVVSDSLLSFAKHNQSIYGVYSKKDIYFKGSSEFQKLKSFLSKDGLIVQGLPHIKTNVMKNVILFSFLFLSQFSNALNLYVVNSSFNDSVPVAYGSAQWVDLQVASGGNTLDSLRLYIQRLDSTGTITYRQRIIKRSPYYLKA